LLTGEAIRKLNDDLASVASLEDDPDSSASATITITWRTPLPNGSWSRGFGGEAKGSI